MYFKTKSLVLIAFLILITATGWSQDLMIYPAQGQSNEQMEKDKFECYGYEKMHDGLGWTMAISEATGQVVLTASGELVAFVVFGACLPL